MLVPSISINLFLIGYSSRLVEQEKTHRWLIVPLQISSLGFSLTNRILFDEDLKKGII